ncbi:MAG TPA: hypothetical protein VK564_07355 [Thermodesulfobacteriota bacterium]|nr:hypothetical protein [Thermodesulfobacteriota bacterium]
MYEHHRQPLLNRVDFIGRMVRHGVVGLALILGSLGIGMIGYHTFESLAWVDAFVNASMILGGMGPVAELRTTAGKIFAGSYALYSGLIFLVVVGVIFAPVVHRFLHRFHAEISEPPPGKTSRPESPV